MRSFSRTDLLASETFLGDAPLRSRGRAVLVFPNTYTVGMSSLAVHTLYSLLNEGGLACERAFLPEVGASPVSRSLETGTPLGGFDYVLVSSSYELDWLQLPAMLEAGGVPALRAERGANHPVVIAGGPAITTNPRPLYDLVDAFVIGELEPIAAGFIEALCEADSREELARRLSALPGVCLPDVEGSGPGDAARLYADDLNAFSTESAVLAPHSELGDRFLIEVGRGCGRGCRFCLARRIYHPARMRQPSMLLERIQRALRHTSRIGLVGAAISDYPWAEELFCGLAELPVQVSVSSVRAESVTPLMLAVLARSGQESLTLAPEAGTEALRCRIGKSPTEESLFACIERALAAGLSRFKLYFMLGLPGETDDDAVAIGELVGRIRTLQRQMAISVSLNPFVPRPHTPLGREPMAPQEVIARRTRMVTSALHRYGVHDVDVGSYRLAAAQTVLGRGGRELGLAIVLASRSGGSVSDLRAAMARAGVSWKQALGPMPDDQD